MDRGSILFTRGWTQTPDFEKFNTCVHRSGPQKYTLPCCENKTETGYVCNALKIYNLQPNHCQGCESYLNPTPKE